MYKRLSQVLYPLFCILIPFLLFVGLDGHSYVLPSFVLCTMIVFSHIIYENKILDYLALFVVVVYSVAFLLVAPIYYAICCLGKWMFVLPCMMFLLGCLLFISNVIIKSGISFKATIIFRKILAVQVALTCATFALPGLYSIIDANSISHLHSFDTNIIGLLSSTFWLLVIIIEIYKESKKLYLFSNYYKPFFILYLRRFSIDGTSSDMKCLDELAKNKFGLEIMKIGNPKSLFQSSFDYSCVYLSTTDWQSQLRHYIKCAKIVFAQVDTSDGVIWEMFENADYMFKYIYNVPKTKDIPLIIHLIGNKISYSQKPMFNRIESFLYYLSKNRDYQGGFLFTFCETGIWYTENINDMLQYKLSGAIPDSLQCYTI